MKPGVPLQSSFLHSPGPSVSMGITSRVADFSPSARHEQVSVSSAQALGGQGAWARLGQCSVSYVKSPSCLPGPTYLVH